MKKILFALAIITASLSQAQAVREIDDPSRIKIDVDAKVEIIYSTQDKIMFNVSESELSSLKVEQKGSSLTIQEMGNTTYEDLRIRIYTSKLTGILTDGGAQVMIQKFPSQKRLIAQANGNSVVNTGDMKIDNLTIMRDTNSQVVSRYAATKKETVDGVVVAVN